MRPTVVSPWPPVALPAGGPVGPFYMTPVVKGYSQPIRMPPVRLAPPLPGSYVTGPCYMAPSYAPPGVIISPRVRAAEASAEPEDPQSAATVLQEATLPTIREVNSVAISRDGRHVAAGLQDNTVQIWDLQSKSLRHQLKGHRYWVNAVAFSPDGVYVASGSADKTIKVWNAIEGTCEETLEGHLSAVAAVAFADDGARLASGGWDKSVCLWDVTKGSLITTLVGHSDWVHAVAWAPGGRQLASASSDHSVRIWNLSTGFVDQVLVGHLQTVTSVSFASNGVHVASGSLDRTVRVWNVQEGSLASKFIQDHDDGTIHSIAFAPDSDKLAIAGFDKTIKIWNFRTGERADNLVGHEDTIHAVCVSADGRFIVSGSHDKTLRVWEMPGHPLSPPLPSRNHAAVGGIEELTERLRATEQMNQRLRDQLVEAQADLEARLTVLDPFSERQESQIAGYRDALAQLQADKEELERKFVEMRREVHRWPTQQQHPPGQSAPVTPLPSTASALPSAALTFHPGAGAVMAPSTSGAPPAVPYRAATGPVPMVRRPPVTFITEPIAMRHPPEVSPVGYVSPPLVSLPTATLVAPLTFGSQPTFGAPPLQAAVR